jgi:hypothetical protein
MTKSSGTKTRIHAVLSPGEVDVFNLKLPIAIGRNRASLKAEFLTVLGKQALTIKYRRQYLPQMGRCPWWFCPGILVKTWG